MKLFKKHKSLFFVSIVGLFYFMFWYTAKNLLEEESKEISDKSNDTEEVFEVKPADVKFRVLSRGDSGYDFLFLETRMENTDTIYDLIERFREDGFITYERVDYKDGPVITTVNGITADEGEAWKIYDDGDLVSDWTRRKLDDNNVYTLKLETISE